MAINVMQTGNAIRVSATGNVSTADCQLIGFWCNSTTSGTVVLRAGGSGGTAISGTITPTAGTFTQFPANCPGGLHATIANTLNVTFFVVEGQA